MATEGKAAGGDGVPLEESNCANIGSAEDKAARLAAAQTEPAWEGSGQKPGVEVWRIEQFQVVPWEKSMYGKFHSGDSYIVLETIKPKGKEALEHNIYFWLGEETTTDEMGTAAYKTVELDDYFGGKPTQNREVQGHESAQFHRIFPEIMYLEGGVESGFNRTMADIYDTRLFQVRKMKTGVVEKQVTLARESLNEGDCFVLDAGRVLYVWHGSAASPRERFESTMLARKLENLRLGRAKATHECDDKFWELLGGPGPVKGANEVCDRIPEPEIGEGVLYKMSDASGDLEMKEVGRGELTRRMLDTNDVMILDRVSEVFIWVGKKSSEVEKKNCFRTATNFLKANHRDSATPIHMYKEGTVINNALWNKIFEETPLS